MGSNAQINDEFEVHLPPLCYLDPDFYAEGTSQEKQTVGIELEGEFICAVCTGVVLDPIECKACSSLYCKGCSMDKNIACPKRCGGSEYGKVNRMIMNALNKLPFRC